LTILVESLCGIKEGGADRDSTMFVLDIWQTQISLCTDILIVEMNA
jgi:hypothetical protein